VAIHGSLRRDLYLHFHPARGHFKWGLYLHYQLVAAWVRAVSFYQPEWKISKGAVFIYQQIMASIGSPFHHQTCCCNFLLFCSLNLATPCCSWYLEQGRSSRSKAAYI
jgi:hypothetical protein